MALKEFALPPRASSLGSELMREIIHPDDAVFGEIEEIVDEEGTLLIVQCSIRGAQFGLVIGFKMSEYYMKGDVGNVKAVMVDTIDPDLQQDYAALLCDRLKGPISFFE